MAKFIPFPFYHDDMPIDISSAFGGTAPAGRHGFLKAAGDRFEFADGTPARFWGVNFNGGACFPPFEFAEKVAARLRKTGVNLVRFHQLDAEWNTPNIFSYQKGERIGNTQTLHPESMKHLDYLIACLKKEGVYLYLDMLTYRNFKSGDGVENAFALGDTANPYCYYNARLIELQKKFIYDIWNHVNPYTGVAYKDDPAIVLSEVVNERDFFSRTGLVDEPYGTEFRQKFGVWLQQKGLSFDAFGCDINQDVEPLVSFKIELQTGYYREMYDYMRHVGVKVPICGTNWRINGAVTKSNQRVNDFMDSHTYFYDWRWGEVEKHCMNRSITQVGEFGMDALIGVRALDRPLFVSEWDMPWPNAYRAESPILYAAVGALQGFGGWAIHTYAYGTRLDDMKILGKEVSSASIGGVPYREGIFSTWNDPAKYGLFYHAALIARRQDVKMAEQSVSVKLNDLVRRSSPEALVATAEVLRAGVTFDDADATGCETIGEHKRVVPEDATEVQSVTGELYRSWGKNYGTIDTGRTKCAYGFLGKNGAIGLHDITVRSDTDFAVIAVSSLTDQDITASDNLLLTAVGRAVNTDAKFDGDRMLDYGKPPVVIEVIEAEISIRLDRPDMKVWAVNAEGMFVGAVPGKYADGTLTFRLGATMPSMYYLIQAE